MGSYDVAQVCINGHVTTASFRDHPQHRRDFCETCGARTITECEHCKSQIPGRYDVDGFVGFGGPYDPPAHCGRCGKPYPWTAAALHAAKELASDLTELTAEEHELLSTSIDQLAIDSPMTAVAAGRFKKLIGRAGPTVGAAFKEILVAVVSESAKKVIWP